jgi:hypothetical protein
MATFTTPKNRPGISHAGYCYRFDKYNSNKDQKFWRCIKQSCVGRVSTDINDANLQVRNVNHNHPPVPEEVTVRRTVNVLNRRARNESVSSLPQIYRQEIVALAAEPLVAAAMPAYRSVQAAMYRRRMQQMPPLPLNRQNIQIPPNMTTTATGERFLLHCSTNNDFIIFCTPSSLDLLCQADIVCVDGTFDVCPALFQQLFTMHAFSGERLLPLVFCFMSSKTRAMYENVFNVLKQESLARGNVFNPLTIMSDFETGLIAAVSTSFPGVQHRGCYFHLTQAIWRQVQQLGLAGSYAAQDNIRLQVIHLLLFICTIL